MSRIETTVVIDRPIEDVWSFLVDPRNLPLWSPDADEVTGLPEGPLASETTLVTSRRIGPLPVSATLQVIEFEPYRALEVRSVGAPLGGSVATRLDLERAGAGTRLTGTSVARGLPRLLAALDPGRRGDRDARFATLKQVIESRTGPAVGPGESATSEHGAALADVDVEAEGGESTTPESPAARPLPAPEPVAAAEPTQQVSPEPPLAEAAGTGVAPSVEDRVGDAHAAERLSAAEDVIDAESAAVEVPGQPETEPEAGSAPRGVAPQVAEVAHRPAADATRLVLRLETERGPAATFEVTSSGATIGRAAENTVRLDDLSVSRRHARITYRRGDFWLSDLKSTGGTWVDGTKLTAPRRLAADQVIGVGILRLRVFAAGAELPADDGPAPAEQVAAKRRRRS